MKYHAILPSLTQFEGTSMHLNTSSVILGVFTSHDDIQYGEILSSGSVLRSLTKFEDNFIDPTESSLKPIWKNFDNVSWDLTQSYQSLKDPNMS